MQTITDIDQFPTDKQAHLCLLEIVEITVRTGRGRGEEETFTLFHFFDDQAELEEWLSRFEHRHKKLIALSAQRIPIKVKPVLEYE